MFKEDHFCQKEILRVLNERIEIFLDILLLSVNEPLEKNIHDLRVSARRLRAILELMGEIKQLESLKKATRKTKKILQLFGRLRDLQVQQLYLKDFIAEFPETNKLLCELKGEEKIELNHCVNEVERLGVKKFQVDLSEVKIQAKRYFKKGEIYPSLKSVMYRDYRRVMDRQSNLDVKRVETFHRLRIDCKKFRYRMEIIEPLLVSNQHITESLKKTQEKLGKIQDLSVALAEVEKYPELCIEGHQNSSFKSLLESSLEKKVEGFVKSKYNVKNGFELFEKGVE